MKSLTQCVIYLILIWNSETSIANTSGKELNNIKEFLTLAPDTIPSSQKIRLPGDKTDPIKLKDPSSITKEVQYDPETNRYVLIEKIGDDIINSTPMTFEEYSKFKNKELQDKYFSQLSGNSDGTRGAGNCLLYTSSYYL